MRSLVEMYTTESLHWHRLECANRKYFRAMLACGSEWYIKPRYKSVYKYSLCETMVIELLLSYKQYTEFRRSYT